MRGAVVDRALGNVTIGKHCVERSPSAAHPALDRTDRAAADRRRFLVGEAAGANQQQRFAAFGWQRQQRAVHVRQVDRFFLPRGSGQHAFGDGLVIFAAEAVAPHVGEIGVAQDHEGPGAHAGAGLEPLLRGPGLEQRFLNQVVRHVRAAAQAACESTQVGDHLGQLALEIGFFGSRPLFTGHQSLAPSWSSRS
ncbi:hypothetical protein A8B77_12730 [Erythrobacter sp. EhN03]|nr:hypothetical protein A8B77_12730 [Erythrobacter sp. EhN03]